MNLSTQPYKGARDFYPEDKRLQKYMFAKLRDVVEGFGYQEYDAPLLEPLDIYLAKTGEEIVNEQLYSFTDKGDRKLAIRPEMTPTVSRMVAGKRQELAYPLRWYSIPNLWRYERPQAGRLREHWQLNVDLFGIESVEADHEMILVADALLKVFGAKPDMYEIRINSRTHTDSVLTGLNIPTDKAQEVTKLVDKKSKMSHEEFTKALRHAIDDDAARKLEEHLGDTSKPPEKLAKLLHLLKNSGITNAVYDPSLVRGFDYYTDIVFEVFDKHPENNRSMAGGGRYDGLVGLFGVEPVPTVGFAMGDVTLQRFLQMHDLLPKLQPETDAVAILVGDVYEKGQKPLAELRQQGARVAVDSTGRKLDAQIKNAVKAGVNYAIFIGEEELASGNFKLRNLQTGEERQLPVNQIVSTLKVRHQ